MILPKDQTCCFTGHRRIPDDLLPELRVRLEQAMRSLYEDGFRVFLFGGARGFDTVAALCALTLRDSLPGMKTAIAVPCGGQADTWSKDERELYEWILEQADDAVCLSPRYTPRCMLERNRYMVDSSSACAFWLRSPRSGTGATVRYAQSQGLRLVDLLRDLVL